MAKLDKRIMVRLSDEVYDKLNEKANRLGHKPSTYARLLIQLAIDPDGKLKAGETLAANGEATP